MLAVDSDESHVIKKGTNRILTTSLIYGPNASGKSNLIKAMEYSRDLIVNGMRKKKRNLSHEKNDGTIMTGPSYFEYIIEKEGTCYSYGFEIDTTKDTAVSEWLYELHDDDDICLFEAKYDELAFNGHLEELKLVYNQINQDGAGDLIIRRTKEYKTIPELERIRDWFENKLYILTPSEKQLDLTPATEDAVAFIEKQLKSFDTGITGMKAETANAKAFERKCKNQTIQTLSKKMKEKHIQQSLLFVDNSSKIYYLNSDDELNIIVTMHGEHKVDFSSESLGTQSLVRLLACLDYMKYENDCTVVIDEIECSVHTLNVCAFLDLFHELNLPSAQLIATTHETYILSREHVRQDEVWFVDHDEKCEGSKIYSLSSFKLKANDISGRYLDGRYGAIPRFTSPDFEGE